MIRPACLRDVPRLREIERAAGVAFRDLDMDAVADDEPMSIQALQDYVRNGRAWVAADSADEPIAYLIVDILDGAGHVEQVSVHPGHAGQRWGRALVDQAAEWAARNGFTTLTLTTFVDVPWNGPYYTRMGFRVLASGEMGEELRRIRCHEAAAGLDRWPRVAMYRPVEASRGDTARTPGVEITAVSPTSPPAERAVRGYLHDVASRYHQRRATIAEVDSALAQHPIDDLVAPNGVFLVATAGAGVVCGCVGLARVTSAIGEVRRLHVGADFRGRGLGRRLMLEVENRGRDMGFAELRLDTRNDLIESQRLYESLGYVETPAHQGGPFSDRWYSKSIR